MRLAPLRAGQCVHGLGFTGLVPSEYSSGGRTHRGRITKSGNLHLRPQLVESAWAYQHGPSVGVELRRRQDGLAPETVARAWAAQARLCGRFRRLAQKKNSKNVVVLDATRSDRVRVLGDAHPGRGRGVVYCS